MEDLHQLPKRFWDTPSLRFNEDELEAVMVSRLEQSQHVAPYFQADTLT